MRVQPVDVTALTADQQRVYDKIASGPRGGVRGPLPILLHNPDLTDRVQALGELLRYRIGIPEQLREIGILVVASRWRCEYEWYAHSQVAAKSGVPADIIQAIREGRTPEFADARQQLVYDFARQVQERQRVSDTTYDAAVEAFGKTGVVELATLIGYFSMVSVMLNAHAVPLPEGVSPAFG